MSQNISLWGATYSDVPSIEVPKSGGGTASFTDVTDTTATASDVASGKYFYLANGARTEGTGSGGGGSVTQDANGYIVLPSTGGSGSPTLITKSITANGTYNASSDNADGYSSVTVNVSGSGGGSFTVAHGALSNNGRTLTFSNLAHAPTAFILMLGVEYYMGEAYITDLYGEDYIVSGVYDGTNSTFYIAAFTDESAFRPYAEAFASDVTWAYSGGTLSITATQAESPLYFKFAGEESYPLYTLYYL